MANAADEKIPFSLFLNPLLVEMPFTVVIVPQAPLLHSLLWSTLPKWEVKMNIAVAPVIIPLIFIPEC